LGGGYFKHSPFFREPRIKVINPQRDHNWKRAKVIDTLEPQVRIALQLNTKGVGTVQEILSMPSDLVLDAWHFHICQAEITDTEYHLNKDNKL